MFAYCLNNPTSGCDPCGTCFHNRKLYNCEKCAATWKKVKTGVKKAYTDTKTFVADAWDDAVTWCVDTYDSIASHYQQQQALDTQIRMQQNQLIANGAKTIWNAYQRGYDLEQESIRLQAEANIDMFDSPADVERSLDAIDATLAFSSSAYNLGMLLTSANPSVGAAVLSVVGLLWVGRGIYRAIQ